MINTGHIMDDGWSSRRWRRDRQEPGRIDLGLPGPGHRDEPEPVPAGERRQALAGKQAEMREKQQASVQKLWDRPQISETRLAGELWNKVKDEDYLFTWGRLRRMIPGVAHISGPDQHLGEGGGGAVGATPGMVLGAGLALKDSGKLPVAILGDGETMSSIQAFWTAAHYHIPGLWVINNNHSYYNDENHQDLIAKFRKRPPENKIVAMRMQDPEVDFSTIAKTFGLHGEGPVKSAASVFRTSTSRSAGLLSDSRLCGRAARSSSRLSRRRRRAGRCRWRAASSRI